MPRLLKIISRWRPAALVLGSGLVMGIIPAPVNAWGLAWVAFAPLWWGVQQCRGQKRRACALGFWWGLGYHGAALSWITGLHPLTWLGLSWGASLAIALTSWLLITLWGALIPALWAGVMSGVMTRYSLGSRLLLGTTLWCSLEWLWTQSPLWWTTLAYTQSPANLVILHLGQLAGTTAITAALVVVNGLVAESWRSQTYRWRYLGGAIAFTLGLHLLGYSLYRQPLNSAASDSLKVGIIQGNIPTRIKLSDAGIQQGITAYVSGYEQLATQGVDAVLMPDGAFPFYWEKSEVRSRPMITAVQAQGVVAWLGTFMPQNETEITQSLITLTPESQGQGRYNKVKLVPLGEYIPFRAVIGQLINRLSPIEAVMVPGRARQTFDTPFGPAIVGICFDSVFPNLFRTQTAQGGEFILTVSNNDPYSYRMMIQHHAHDVMRAIESDRWAIRATNTGLSGIVDPHGHTQWLSQRRTYAVHAHEIQRRHTQLPYVKWGDAGLACLISGSGLSVLATNRGKM